LTQDKFDRLKLYLQALEGPVAIAYSGGVDSSLLLIAALNWCRYPGRAITLVSQFLSHMEQTRLNIIAEEIGIRPVKLAWDPLSHPEITANTALRCYSCKRQMYSALLDQKPHHYRYVLDGTHADDLKKERAGLTALQELGVSIPLAECQITKSEIRTRLREWGFSFWNKPSESCLATKLAKDSPISLDGLAMVESKLTH